MGLFDFIGDLASASVKVALTPIAIVKDTVSVVTGDEPNTTINLLESAAEDVTNSIDSLGD